MKLSTPQSPRPKTPPSFLFRGPPGGGKTSMLMQFPAVWIGDIDLNLNGPQERLKVPFAYDYISLDDNSNPILIEKTGMWDTVAIWLRLKQKILDVAKDPTIKVLAVDGITQMNFLLTQKVMADLKVSTMERQHWIPFRQEFMQVIMRCRNLGKVFIATCHEEKVIATDGTVSSYNTAMSSRLKDVMGGLFTDVYYFEATEGAAGKRKFVVQTGGDTRRTDLKTSFPTMPLKIDVTDGFAALNRYMNLPS